MNESLGQIFLIFLRLGLTSFGGPIAHLGYFREELVTRRRWLSEQSYADLVALCQFLPGPASSQVGLALGLMRHGYAGALAAWCGFTLPSAAVLILFAQGMTGYAYGIPPGMLHGLKLVAVAVVAQAVWNMGRSLCNDTWRIGLMTAAACAMLLLPGSMTQVVVIFSTAMIGMRLFAVADGARHDPLPIALSRRTGLAWLTLFATLLAALPVAAADSHNTVLAQINAFYRTGALVFGGGHVVLPLLQAAVVPAGWVDNSTFLAGYGATQAVPGPLFTYAAFLGASMKTGLSGWTGALVCLLAIFAPSFLLVPGMLPFWERLRRNPRMQGALSGVNAAVVGLLLAALYQPVWTSAILRAQDFALALIAFIALTFWKQPPWRVVAGCMLLGLALPGKS